MFGLSPKCKSQNVVGRDTAQCTRYKMSFIVLYSPPHLDAVMQKDWDRKSKVPSQMCSTPLTDDACLNDIVDKTCHVHKVF